MDIVERLRFGVALDEQGDVSWCNQEAMINAADEIERLRKENAELVKGLKRLNRVAQDSYGSMASSFVQSIVKQTIAKATGVE